MNIFTNNEFSVEFLLIALLWVLPWKAYALWQSAKHNQKGWFVALLIINTFGLLEIIYIFVILRKKFSEVKRSLLTFLGLKKKE